MLFGLTIVACTIDPGVHKTDEAVSDGSWQDATLVVSSPLSGAFIELGSDARFVATVRDGDGNPLDFDAITWSTNLDSEWSAEGSDVLDHGLGVGRHDITATAVLPNGDRLASTAGGILVQSPYAGIYSGNLSVELTMSGYTAACVGAVTLVVNPEGDAAEGDANCLLDLYGYSVDTTYQLDLMVDDGILSGVSQADLTVTTWDFPTDGEVTEDGVLTGGFAESILGYLDLSGQIAANRVTRETE